MTHDETGGWIFSDEAHNWMDRNGNAVADADEDFRGDPFTIKTLSHTCQVCSYQNVRFCGGARHDADGPHTKFAATWASAAPDPQSEDLPEGPDLAC